NQEEKTYTPEGSPKLDEQTSRHRRKEYGVKETHRGYGYLDRPLQERPEDPHKMLPSDGYDLLMSRFTRKKVEETIKVAEEAFPRLGKLGKGITMECDGGWEQPPTPSSVPSPTDKDRDEEIGEDNDDTFEDATEGMQDDEDELSRD